jgi:hypothetical protein
MYLFVNFLTGAAISKPLHISFFTSDSLYFCTNASTMHDYPVRYKTNPHITDTNGFYNTYIPFNPDIYPNTNDSLKAFGINSGDNPNLLNDTLFVRETVSIFRPHQLQAINHKHVLKTETSANWIVGLLILCLMAIAFIQATIPKRLQQVFRSVALPYYVNQLEREGNLLSERMSLALLFVYYSSLSLLLYKAVAVFSPEVLLNVHGIILFLGIFVILIILSLLKTATVTFIGNVFKTAKSAHDYLINNLIFNIVTGLLLFPAVIFCIYIDNPVYLWIAGLIVAILLIYRFIRSFMIGLSNTRYSIFYLFLYLCTLEILPLLILFKTVQKF